MNLLGPLSFRQRETLALVADGHTGAEIAELMAIALSTAERHVFDLKHKLGARNRAHAVALGYRTGQLALDARADEVSPSLEPAPTGEALAFVLGVVDGPYRKDGSIPLEDA